jgi:hypothetical protein
MKAGRELDALVAEKVMGWSDVGNITIGMTTYVAGHRPKGEQTVVPAYSTSMAAAWAVVDALRARGLHLAFNDTLSAWRVLFFTVGRFDTRYFTDGANYEFADTPAHAICLAALRAVGVEVGE